MVIDNRIWPNKAEITIYTEPILATLSVNENNQERYWRISQNGRVLTEDTAGIRENVINLKKAISVTDGSSFTTLAGYSFENSPTQLNRFWFSFYIREYLENLGLDIISMEIESLVDSYLTVTIFNGTKLYFESDNQVLAREHLEDRVNTIFTSEFNDRIKNNEINYIDFRIPSRKIFICQNGGSC